ncbi:hypothetical protein BDW62DRAFT_58424 [Aspergillus aurantiobrunneus]
MLPSRSLEGLERAIPPSPPLPLAQTRSRLHLDKPLPDLPAPSPPPPFMTGSTAWSDDSSTVNSFDDHDDDRQSSASTESYPVFVRSGSDDLADLADHDHHRDPPHDHPSGSTLDPDHHANPPKPAPPTLTFLADSHCASSRSAPNHYFREKKWDFFPELATPSAFPANSPHNHFAPRPRKKDSVRSRWIPIPADKGAALANDMRNSFRSIQRRLSRNSLDKEKKPKRNRPTTAPTDSPYSPSTYSSPQPPQPRTAPAASPSDRSDHSLTHPPLYIGIGVDPDITVSEKMAHLSISPTGSSISDQSLLAQTQSQSQTNTPLHTKHLAVPITPYQKYGAAICDKSGREKKRLSYRQTQRVRFPKYRSRNRDRNRDRDRDRERRTSMQRDALVSLRPKSGGSSRPRARLPLQRGTRYAVRALQDRTSHMLVAIDGARKKIVRAGTGGGTETPSKLDMRRTHLKSQIRLVGPVNPYTSYRGESVDLI